MSQAVSAPSTGACAFTGGKTAKATGISTGFVGQESPSRRAVLAGAGIVALGLSANLPAAARPISDFATKVAAFEHADAILIDHDAVVAALIKKWEAAIARIPHVTVEFRDGGGIVHRMSTADDIAVERARRHVQSYLPLHSSSVRVMDAYRELIAADDAIKAERLRLLETTGLAAAEKRNEALTDWAWGLMDAVIEHPTDSADDVMVKLMVVRAKDRWDVTSVIKAISADLDRIARRSMV